jgi:hypothetical protein
MTPARQARDFATGVLARYSPGTMVLRAVLADAFYKFVPKEGSIRRQLNAGSTLQQGRVGAAPSSARWSHRLKFSGRIRSECVVVTQFGLTFVREGIAIIRYQIGCED